MFEGLLRCWRSLLRTETSHPAPTAPEPAEGDALVAGLADLWSRDPSWYRPFFITGRPAKIDCRDVDLFRRLAALGVVERLVSSYHVARVRLFPFEGLFIATDLESHRATDQVFSLMLEQVYFARHLAVRDGESVLEVGAGSGAISLAAASVAGSVVAVDVNPRALAFSRFNARLNGREIDLREGSLFDPVGDRRFDRIVSNPPFEPVPPGASWFRHSAGGEDGLDLVRRLLDGLDEHLSPDGSFAMVTWTTGGEHGLDLDPLLEAALPRKAIRIDRIGEEPLDRSARRFRGVDGYAEWRARLAERGIDRIYLVFVLAEPSGSPAITRREAPDDVDAAYDVVDDWSGPD